QATTEETAEARAALAALAALPGRQRMVMVLHLVHGLSQPDIAEQLNIRRSTVAAHVFKARRTLEEVLGMHPTERGEERTGLLAGGRPAGLLRPVTLLAQTGPADPLAERLRAAEDWLRAGFEADPDAVRAACARLPRVPSGRRGGERS
ncbi:sigma-70 family RNA polymerase sigma factor, partial [Kitasatospora sp. NPDC058965]|uniref:sigma-70 family RNA polymerase sigma factor n=1 Tax=Kitasatospora sp. NPDC058965 TaxID=3346682 RepID=UPI0036C8AEA5